MAGRCTMYRICIYEGEKEMLLVDEVDNKQFLTGLLTAMYEELPTPKVKQKK